MKKLLLCLVLVSGLFGENKFLCNHAREAYWGGYNRLVAAVSLKDYSEIMHSYDIMKTAYFDTQEHCSDRKKKLFTESFLLIEKVMHAK